MFSNVISIHTEEIICSSGGVHWISEVQSLQGIDNATGEFFNFEHLCVLYLLVYTLLTFYYLRIDVIS
jgi:hypothetical protein